MTILEAYRGTEQSLQIWPKIRPFKLALLISKYIPTSPLEFHFYSAEEVRFAAY
jgi:hypothetical protein